MKRTLLLLATVFLLVPAGTGEACPLLYVFQGTVTENMCLNPDPSSRGSCSWVIGTDIPVGTAVAFHILIDFDVPTPFDILGTDTFYAEYLSGPSPWANDPSWSSTLGADTGTETLPVIPDAWLLGGNPDNWPYQLTTGVFQLYTVTPDMQVSDGYRWGGPRVSDLVVGDHMQGVDVFDEDSGPYIRYDDLTLTSIDPCSPFPGGGSTGGCFPGPPPFPGHVPDAGSTLLMLGMGLAGVSAWRRWWQ